MSTRTVFAALVAVFLSTSAFADAASGMASGKRQHKPISTAQPAADQDEQTRGKNRDARKAAREKAEEIAAGKKDDDDVASKTDKSEAARAKKKH